MASHEPPKPRCRTLIEIVTDIKKHREEFSRHGNNCVCMDKFARELKAQIREVLPDMHDIEPPPNKVTRQTVYSLGHVLGMVTRSL